MKRSIQSGLALLLLGILLLAACGSRKDNWVTGLVTELQTDDSGRLTAFVVRQGDRETGILLTEKTALFPEGSGSATAEELQAAFQAALRPDVLVQADCARRKRPLTTGGGARITAYEADYVHIIGRLDRGVVTMSDGTPIDRLEERDAHTYRLADGTELLRVRAPYGPENSYAGGVEGFDSLGETAQNRVRAYYEQRGLLYDEQAELEKVYALYREESEGFQEAMAGQGVTPSASGGRVIYFLTTVSLPAGVENGNVSYTVSLSDAFDRETGEHIDPWALFTVPKDTVIQTLLDKAGIRDPALRAEMAAAPWDGRITFRSDGISVEFEPGSLPSQMYSTGFGLDYDADLTAMMQDWAVPRACP